MDFQIFTIINHFARLSGFLDVLGIFFAVYALPVLFIVILVLGAKRRSLLFYGIASSALAYGVNAIIGLIVVRHRPFVDHVVNQLIQKSATSKSFPSDHAAISFALAGVLSYFYPKWTIAIYVFAFLIALSRVFVGVHYPTDIVVGAAVGIFSALIMRIAFGSRLAQNM